MLPHGRRQNRSIFGGGVKIVRRRAVAVLDPNVWGGYSPSPGMDNGVCPWAGSGRVTASQGWPFPECLKTFRGIDYRSVQQNAMVLIMYLHISLNNASINSVYLLLLCLIVVLTRAIFHLFGCLPTSHRFLRREILWILRISGATKGGGLEGA